jgi:YD repeat-containing protein
MKLRFAKVVALLVGFAMVVQALPAGAGQFKAVQRKAEGQVRSEESKAKSPVKDLFPAADPDWDPKDPAAVQYSDGAWGIAYVDNANPPNLLFRRSLGGADPQYWRDQLTVESAAERPSMVRLGGTTALFYGKISGGVREVFLKTSTDDGATWSSPTQLTSGSPAHVYEINTVNVDGTIHMFWSLSNTSGQLQYKTSSDLANWSAASTVGQPIGPLQSSTIPTFDIEMLASGEWAMSWLNVSIAGGGGQPINDLGWPVVWFGKSADLASSSWSNKAELMAGSPFGMRFPKSVTLAQDSAGTVKVAFESQRYPSDQYIYAVSSADAGTTFTGAELVGYEPTRSTNGSGDSYARRPYAVATNEGPVRLFWDMEVPIWAGSYPAQLFRRDLTPGAGITQISVSKEQMAKCGPCVPSGAFVADPINATTGNFTLPETEFMIPGKGPSLSFTRTYNAHRLVDSPLGFGWTHNFAESVQTFSRGEALVIDGTGRNDLYTPKAGGGYDPPPGRFATLVQNPDTTFTLTETDFTVKTFNQDGHLSSITDRNGNSLSLAYDPGQKLTSVTDESGRTLTFAYQGNRISTITDPLNRTVGYGYSPAGDLISITDPRAKVWTHTYCDYCSVAIPGSA